MKKLLFWTLSFIKADFSWIVYIYSALFLSLSIYLNYFTNSFRVLSEYSGTLSVLWYCAFYAVAYYGIALPQALFRKNTAPVCRLSFWCKSAFLILLLALVSSGILPNLIRALPLPKAEMKYVLPLSFYLQFWLVLLVPIMILRYGFDRGQKTLYGLSAFRPNSLPYLAIIVFLLPLVIAASFQIAFLLTYPLFKPWLHTPAFGLNLVQMTLLFECAYGGSLVLTELLFRGAFTLGMKTVLNRNVILPMVAVYVFTHFGKPPAEAIGSVFAGYFLGVLAYQSNSITGGILVHIGIAYAMESAAFIQHYFRYFS